MYKVDVVGVYLAPSIFGGTPVVLLKDPEDRILQIFIGTAEALAIHSAIKKITPPRPMTHDLIYDILRRLNVEIERIVIDDLIENTFYARIFLRVNDMEHEIDARPSDSIALALRFNADIFVVSSVFEEAGFITEIPEEYVPFDSLSIE